MAAKHPKFSWDHPVIVTFVLIAVVASMSLAAEVLKPLALSVLLSFALSPLARLLERRGLPRAPAVILTVFLALGALGGIAYAVYGQLEQIAGEIPKYEKRIIEKIDHLKLGQPNKLQGLQKVGEDVARSINKEKTTDPTVQNVQIVSEPDFRTRLESSIGPYLKNAGEGAFILILVLFMLMNREDLSDRVVQLFGRRRVTLTTRTMEEVGQRISRYLAMFATVNSTFGLIVGLGLWAIGVQYAILWGFLAAVLRFIPYIGPGTAFALPLIFSIATAKQGSWQPIEVAALFGVLEVAANSFLEPIIYGKTTGVSALGLLVAAMFWTWLWGPLGSAALDAHDGLPGGHGQVCAQPRLLRDPAGRGGGPRRRTSASISASWRWTRTARPRSSRRGSSTSRGSRSTTRPDPGPLPRRARLRPRRGGRPRAGVHPSRGRRQHRRAGRHPRLHPDGGRRGAPTVDGAARKADQDRGDRRQRRLRRPASCGCLRSSLDARRVHHGDRHGRRVAPAGRRAPGRQRPGPRRPVAPAPDRPDPGALPGPPPPRPFQGPADRRRPVGRDGRRRPRRPRA